MKFRLTLSQSSNSPLLMHRGDLADPMDYYSQETKKLTSIRKKTDDTRAQIDKFSWLGGLYLEDGEIVYPTFNVWRTIQEAAKLTRSGRKVERGLLFDGASVEFTHEGPKDLDNLYALPDFVSRKMVVVDRKRIARVRPQFRHWTITLTGEIDESVMSPDEFEHFVNEAGRKVGLGDARKLGYGRFAAVIDWL